MSRPDLYADGFPHGTHLGYEQGCTGTRCPYAEELGRSCSEAKLLYQGDYVNRKRVLSGMTLSEILAAERADVAAAVLAKAKPRPAAAVAVKPKRVPKAKAPKPPRVLKVKPLPKVVAHGTVEGYRKFDCVVDSSCPSTPSCAEANLIRLGARPPRRGSATGAPKPPRVPSAPRRPRGPGPVVHGTQYGQQRGCKTIEMCPEHAAGRPSCTEVNRTYHREYAARRKAEGDVRSHGTESGYAMGCHDRESCEAALAGGTSCTDAMLANDVRRRRANGVPPRGELVDVGPVLEHITMLRASGMSPHKIAAAAGISRSFVGNLAYGRSTPGSRKGEVPKRVNRLKAELILSIHPANRTETREQ